MAKPRAAGAARGPTTRSVGGVPDQRIAVFTVLAGCAAEIGIDAARPELGGSKGQRHIGLARCLAGADPAGPDLDAFGINPVVGLDVAALGAIGADLDRCADREGFQLAYEAFFDEIGRASCRERVCPYV